jgi:ATPase subunit of ABC transporter with duplicated ATPase domains
LQKREKEQQAKLEKEKKVIDIFSQQFSFKKEKEATKKAEEEKKKVEAMKPVPIIEEKTVFTDDRTSMVITYE